MTPKLDIFETMSKISRKQFNWFSELNAQEQKTFAPIVVTRWLSGSGNTDQIELVNEFVNTKVFSLHQHPDLLYKLMTAANVDSGKKSWVPKNKPTTKCPNIVKMLSEYYNIPLRHADDVIELLTKDTILDIATYCGYQQDDVKKISDELKRLSAHN